MMDIIALVDGFVLVPKFCLKTRKGCGRRPLGSPGSSLAPRAQARTRSSSGFRLQEEDLRLQEAGSRRSPRPRGSV